MNLFQYLIMVGLITSILGFVLMFVHKYFISNSIIYKLTKYRYIVLIIGCTLCMIYNLRCLIV
jgi:hypothetical protein